MQVCNRLDPPISVWLSHSSHTFWKCTDNINRALAKLFGWHSYNNHSQSEINTRYRNVDKFYILLKYCFIQNINELKLKLTMSKVKDFVIRWLQNVPISRNRIHIFSVPGAEIVRVKHFIWLLRKRGIKKGHNFYRLGVVDEGGGEEEGPLFPTEQPRLDFR